MGVNFYDTLDLLTTFCCACCLDGQLLSLIWGQPQLRRCHREPVACLQSQDTQGLPRVKHFDVARICFAGNQQAKIDILD